MAVTDIQTNNKLIKFTQADQSRVGAREYVLALHER